MNRRGFLKTAIATGIAGAFGKASFETAQEYCRLNFIQTVNVINPGGCNCWHTRWGYKHNGKELLEIILASGWGPPRLWRHKREGERVNEARLKEACDLIQASFPVLAQGVPSFSVDVPAWAIRVFLEDTVTGEATNEPA